MAQLAVADPKGREKVATWIPRTLASVVVMVCLLACFAAGCVCARRDIRKLCLVSAVVSEKQRDSWCLISNHRLPAAVVRSQLPEASSTAPKSAPSLEPRPDLPRPHECHVSSCDFWALIALPQRPLLSARCFS